MERISIGFIGAGLVAHGHALALRSIIDGTTFGKDAVELAKVFDVDRKKAAVFAEQHGVKEICTHGADLLGDSAVNAVYICTPTAYHKINFLAAAEGGKNVFIEKPLAFSTNEIREMIETSHKYNIKAQAGLVLRHDPVFWYLKNLLELESDNYGSLLSFSFRSDQEWPLCGSFHDSGWRNNPREAFAGCLFEHSIHDIDLIRYLFGEVKDLSANLGYRSNNCKGPIEDSAVVNLELENGASGNLISLYHSIKGRDVRRMEIFFEKAAIILDDYRPGGFDKRYRELTVEVSGQRSKRIDLQEIDRDYYRYLGKPPLLYPDMVSAYRYQALSFLNALRENRRPEPDLETALKAHELIESIYDFSRQRRQLKIPV